MSLNIFVPKELIQNEMELELRMGVLMAFCWIRRYGSYDGYYSGTMEYIMKEYGLHYDETKTKQLPKQMVNFVRGLDYLLDKGILNIKEGDYYDIHSLFVVKITYDKFEKRYVSLNSDYFDYIFAIEKRINKMGLLYILLFVLCGFVSKKNSNGKKEYFHACAYSLDGMAYKTGLTRISVYNYLKNLSIEEGSIGNAPLVKSRLWYITINGQIIRFPNIFVENIPNYEEIIELQREILKNKFRTKEDKIEVGYDSFDNDNFGYYADFDETEFL